MEQQVIPSQQSIFCQECGTSNIASAKFCTNCGTAISINTVSTHPPQTVQPPSAHPNSFLRQLMLAGLTPLVLPVLGFLALYFFVNVIADPGPNMSFDIRGNIIGALIGIPFLLMIYFVRRRYWK